MMQLYDALLLQILLTLLEILPLLHLMISTFKLRYCLLLDEFTLVNKCLLSTYYVPGIEIRAKSTMVNETYVLLSKNLQSTY